MKQRFSYLDLRLVVNEWREELLGIRLNNVYTLEAGNRFFLFKFDGQKSKTYLLVDPGYRIHLTKFQHPTTMQPSGFVAKLRKHLKSRRVSRLWVAPNSRLLVVSFSDGIAHLVFEFFAGGNALLLDENFEIKALMRSVKNNADYAVGRKYEISFDAPVATQIPSQEVVASWLGKDRVGKAVFSKVSNASLSLIEYCLQAEGVDPKSKEADPLAVRQALIHAASWADELMAKSSSEGFILRKVEDDTSLEFEAFREYFDNETAKDSSLKVVRHDTYNKTVDEYFGAITSDRQVTRTEQLKSQAESRLTAARNEKENRIKGLDEVQELNEKKGRLLELNSQLVADAISSVNQLISQGVDWVDIGKLITLEKQKKNSVAMHIGKLDLANNSISLLLEDEDEYKDGGQESDLHDDDVDSLLASDDDDDDEEDEDEAKPAAKISKSSIDVKVQLDKTPWANARDYFEIRRAAVAKKEKTAQQAEKALKSAERKIKKDLDAKLEKTATTAQALYNLRETYWFEKFYWFLTSDDYLVIGGRDALQNDLLLSRYFGEHDVVVYTDVPKASLLIVKNKSRAEISPQALDQAGAFTVASSQAWETKSPAPAWFLTRAQVPRLSANGDPIRLTDVAISPLKKRILPSSFEMGFGLLWKTDGEAVERGLGDQLADDIASEDSDDEFPDTRADSDDEFPDTHADSDDEMSDHGFPSDEMLTRLHDVNEPEEKFDTELEAKLEDLEGEKNAEDEGTTDESTVEAEDLRNAAKEEIERDPTPHASRSGSPESFVDEDFEQEVTEALERDSPQSDEHASADTAAELEDVLREPSPPASPAESSSDSPEQSRDQTPEPEARAGPRSARVRGKSKKLQKLKQRYGEQDDEDRQAAMERLGTLRGLQRIEQEKQEREKQRREEADWKKQRQERAKRAELARIADEVVEETPLPDDLHVASRGDAGLVAAVGTFAPWAALKHVQHRIKVVPGAMKKGKAVQEALRALLPAKDEKITSKQRDLVAAIRQPDLQQAVPVAKLQLATAGGKTGKSASKTASKTKGSSNRGKKKK